MSEENNSAQPKKRSVGKLIAKILLGVAIALVAVLLLALWQLDRIAAAGTRTVGTMLTGTQVDVKNISISPFSGKVVVENFTVANPEGFHNPIAIKVEKLHIAASIKSLLSDKVEIEHLEVSGVAIDVEAKLGSGTNLDVILKNVEKATGADKKKDEQPAEKPAESEKSAAQKQVVIKKLVLNNNKLTVSSGLTKTSTPLYLPPIEMENVGAGKSLAETVSDVLTQIIAEIGKVVDFKKIGKALKQTGEDILKGLDKATDSVGDTVVSAGDSAGKALDDTLQSTKKLLKGLPGLGK
jgi:uncharacterized protein involved in outer membrane biogenesis